MDKLFLGENYYINKGMRYINENKLNKFRSLLHRNKININDKDMNNLTFLFYAIICERNNFVEYILGVPGVNPNIKCSNTNKTVYDLINEKREKQNFSEKVLINLVLKHEN